MRTLRKYSEERIGEDCESLTGSFDNALFAECAFDKLQGLTLKDCVLYGSRFNTDSVVDALGLTLTLNCASFKGVRLSPLLFDLLLMLLYLTVGNDSKREKLLDLVGTVRAASLLRLMRGTE